MKWLVTGTCLLAVLLSPTESPAFERDDSYALFCTGFVHWPVHACPTTSCSISSFAFKDLCSEDSSTNEENAAAWAFWMWGRESTLSAYLWWDTSTCSSASDWYADNYDSEFDFKTVSGAIGRAITDSTDVCAGSSHKHINNADIQVETSDTPFAGNEINSVDDCLTLGAFKEDTFAHEVGHTYGLEHDDDYPHLMHSSGQTHMCNVGSGWHGQPHADDQAGAVANYGRNTDNVKNLSGMPFFPQSGAETLNGLALMSYCGTSNISITLTVMNYYAALADNTYVIRPMLVPVSNPSPTAGSAVWTGSAVTVNPPVNPATHNMTQKLSITATVPSTSLPHSTELRMWVQIDSPGNHSETDEGDNFIPLNIHIVRHPSC